MSYKSYKKLCIEKQPVCLSPSTCKRIPFLIFEDSNKFEIKGFIDSIDKDLVKDYILILDVNTERNIIEKEFVNKYDKKHQIGMLTKSFNSMMAGQFTVENISSYWYAVHLKRHVDEDLSKQYNDIETNKRTYMPEKNEDMKNYANRVIEDILKNDIFLIF